MSDLDSILAANRDAVDDLIEAAERCETEWTTPRAVGKLFLKRVVKKEAFPNSKTNKAMEPIGGPATVDEVRTRLAGALDAFERDCRERAASGGTLESGAFGTVTVEEYAKFVELHTRHHTKQMPVVL